MKYMQNNELFVNNLIGFLCHIFTFLQDSPLKEKFNSILSEFIELNERGDRLFNAEQLIILNGMRTPNAMNGGAAVERKINWEDLALKFEPLRINNESIDKIRSFIAGVGMQLDNLRLLVQYANSEGLETTSIAKYTQRITSNGLIDTYLFDLFEKKPTDKTYKPTLLKMKNVINLMKQIVDELKKNGVNTLNMLSYMKEANNFLLALEKVNPFELEHPSQLQLPPKYEMFRPIKKSALSLIESLNNSVMATELASLGSVTDIITEKKREFNNFIEELKKMFEDTVHATPTSGASAVNEIPPSKTCDPLIKLNDDQVKILTTQEYRHFLVENLDKANLKNFQIDCEEFNCEPRRPGAGAGAAESGPGAAEVIPDERIEKISRQLQQYDYLLAYLKEIIKNEKPEIDFTIYHCSQASPCINLVFHFDPYDENLSILDSIANAVKHLIPEANLQPVPGVAAAMSGLGQGGPTGNTPKPQYQVNRRRLGASGRESGAGGAGGAGVAGVDSKVKSNDDINEMIMKMVEKHDNLVQANQKIIFEMEKTADNTDSRLKDTHTKNNKKIEILRQELKQMTSLYPFQISYDHYGIIKLNGLVGGGKSYKNETRIKISTTTNKYKNHKIKNKMKTLKRLKN